jgi:hypothetical protein
MIEVLKFVFSSFWVYAGVVLLIGAVAFTVYSTLGFFLELRRNHSCCRCCQCKKDRKENHLN